MISQTNIVEQLTIGRTALGWSALSLAGVLVVQGMQSYFGAEESKATARDSLTEVVVFGWWLLSVATQNANLKLDLYKARRDNAVEREAELKNELAPPSAE